jgi:tetratricopeptide (TPR) repeat protein
LAKQAIELFKGKKYKEAAAAFEKINELMGGKHPQMTFNAARAYEMAGDPAGAVIIFKKYLTLPNISVEGKRRAKEKIATLSVPGPAVGR